SALWNLRLAGGQTIKGIDPEQLKGATRFNVNGFNTGGTGARPQKDGLSVTSFPSGVRNVAVEIMEISNGEPAPMIISATFDRIVHPARGSEGGHSGGAGRVSLRSGTTLRG